jgi:putative endonuclease
MAEAHELGQTGEDIAAGYLKKKGYKILRKNWKSGRLEVDIIAENNEFLIFVEVKTRSADFKVHPVDSVSREKQRSLILAADNFIKWNDTGKECRFDIVTVIRDKNNFEVDHIENAFYPTLR